MVSGYGFLVACTIVVIGISGSCCKWLWVQIKKSNTRYYCTYYYNWGLVLNNSQEGRLKKLILLFRSFNFLSKLNFNNLVGDWLAKFNLVVFWWYINGWDAGQRCGVTYPFPQRFQVLALALQRNVAKAWNLWGNNRHVLPPLIEFRSFNFLFFLPDTYILTRSHCWPQYKVEL